VLSYSRYGPVCVQLAMASPAQLLTTWLCGSGPGSLASRRPREDFAKAVTQKSKAELVVEITIFALSHLRGGREP
jgi:hypothetical protein